MYSNVYEKTEMETMKKHFLLCLWYLITFCSCNQEKISPWILYYILPENDWNITFKWVLDMKYVCIRQYLGQPIRIQITLPWHVLVKKQRTRVRKIPKAYSQMFIHFRIISYIPTTTEAEYNSDFEISTKHPAICTCGVPSWEKFGMCHE